MLGKRCRAGLDLFVCGSGSSSTSSQRPRAPSGCVPRYLTAPCGFAVPKVGNEFVEGGQLCPINPGDKQSARLPREPPHINLPMHLLVPSTGSRRDVGGRRSDSVASGGGGNGSQRCRAPSGCAPRDLTAPCGLAVLKGGNEFVEDGKLCPINPGDKQSARVPREPPRRNLPMPLVVPSTDSRLDVGGRRSDSVASGGGGNGLGKSSSSNVVAFHPDCGRACCNHVEYCSHNNRVVFRLSEVGDGVFFTKPCVHDGANESADSEDSGMGMVFLNIQLFLRRKSTSRGTRHHKKTFVAGAISREVAARAGMYLAERFYGEFAKYSLRKRMYKGEYLTTTIEFPKDFFDEAKTSPSQLKKLLGTELWALKRAAEVEFQRKHGTEVSTWLMWASWKLPESLESTGTFDVHLDYPEHLSMFGTAVVATMFRSVAEYVDYRPAKR
jgi:hypothetical protein